MLSISKSWPHHFCHPNYRPIILDFLKTKFLVEIQQERLFLCRKVYAKDNAALLAVFYALANQGRCYPLTSYFRHNTQARQETDSGVFILKTTGLRLRAPVWRLSG